MAWIQTPQPPVFPEVKFRAIRYTSSKLKTQHSGISIWAFAPKRVAKQGKNGKA